LSAAVRQLDHGHVDRAIPLQRRQTQVGNHCLRQAKSAITTNGMPKSVIIANPVPVDVSWWLVAHQIVCEWFRQTGIKVNTNRINILVVLE